MGSRFTMPIASKCPVSRGASDTKTDAITRVDCVSCPTETFGGTSGLLWGTNWLKGGGIPLGSEPEPDADPKELGVDRNCLRTRRGFYRGAWSGCTLCPRGRPSLS